MTAVSQAPVQFLKRGLLSPHYSGPASRPSRATVVQGRLVRAGRSNSLRRRLGLNYEIALEGAGHTDRLSLQCNLRQVGLASANNM